MTFDPTSVPAGCVYRPVPFLLERPVITPRSMFAHTMAARGRSTVESAWNHANAAPNSNTLPHYALGLDETDGCQKFLATNRRGIATTTVQPTTRDTSGRLIWPTLTDDQRSSIRAHGNVRDWSLAIETADTGSDADPGIGAFTDYQIEMLVRIYVHELGGWNIPATPLSTWWGAGAATHTLPFDYPYTTLYRGKICPGQKKKAQFFAIVLPEVARRVSPPPIPAPDPPPPSSQEDLMLAAIAKTTDAATLAQFAFRGPVYTVGETADHDVTPAEVFGRGGGRAYDIVNRKVVSWASPENQGSWGAVEATKTQTEVRALMAGN